MTSQAYDLRKKITDYYNSTYYHYRALWTTSKTRAMHYGFTDDKVKSHDEALNNMNRVLAERVGIREGELVLDAGCGVGGSAIWLAKNRRARVIGIDVTPNHVQRATRYARENAVQNLIEFSFGDFTAMSFMEETFDVVWAIESVCHAPDKQTFVREAHRVLKPGGRLVVADGFRPSRPLPPEGEELLHSWLSAWAVPDLAAPNEFVSHLSREGFTDIKFEDITPHVMPSSVRLYRMYALFSPFVKLFHTLRLFPWEVTNARGARDQYRALSKGLWLYGIVTAVKSLGTIQPHTPGSRSPH